MNNISPDESAFNLSKREYLAAKFLQGLLSSADASFFCGGNSEQLNHMFLSRAVDLADEFLEYFERDKSYVINKKPKFNIRDKVYFVEDNGDKVPSTIADTSYSVVLGQWEYFISSHKEPCYEYDLLPREDGDNE
ncbi:hypothetical protein [Gloeothece verrucosa]|uniref:Uncharacterized protein n=1 Tax=Gloeothece verrucosa (strain PCC 7822) TaxID=497965 RepID=E0UDQ1_GLOV7|nr:hypothetical protein [Gloeothece verrucosa]ADN16486.1 hypothetical protein Cyan7822_4577 [Gloeothece verrucosa PCC 7822]